jgi:hypothetical protein
MPIQLAEGLTRFGSQGGLSGDEKLMLLAFIAMSVAAITSLVVGAGWIVYRLRR